MHIGRVLIAKEGEEQSVLSDWQSRGGDNGVFTVDLIQCVTALFTVEVFDKNSEESGLGASAGTIVSSTNTTGLHKVTISGLKELVRYKFSVVGDGGFGGVLYRVLPVTWFDTAVAP